MLNTRSLSTLVGGAHRNFIAQWDRESSLICLTPFERIVMPVVNHIISQVGQHFHIKAVCIRSDVIRFCELIAHTRGRCFGGWRGESPGFNTLDTCCFFLINYCLPVCSEINLGYTIYLICILFKLLWGYRLETNSKVVCFSCKGSQNIATEARHLQTLT